VRAGKLIKKAWAAVGALATVAVLGARLMFPSLADADPNRFLHLIAFLLGQGALEIVVALLAVSLFYALRWLFWGRVRPANPLFTRLLVLILVSSLAVPGYPLARARAFFWWRLARNTYAIQYIEIIDRQAATGRVLDALELARTVGRSLNGTSYDSDVDWRTRELDRRIALSTLLANDVIGSQTGAKSSLPSDRQRFFTLGEALRLNPQNYGAATALTKSIGLLEGALDADLPEICALGPATGDIRGHAFSLLEIEARRFEFQSTQDCRKARRTLEEAWALPRAKCLTNWARMTREAPGGGAQDSPIQLVCGFDPSSVPVAPELTVRQSIAQPPPGGTQ